MILAPTDLAYPVRLANLRTKRKLTISGPLDHNGVAVAIVGSRHPTKEAAAFTHRLATGLARSGVLVISGGAKGIDATAHEAALAVGRTWCVAPSGRHHPFPKENAELFDRIASSSGSRMIWPFDDDQEKDGETPKQRNEILVALAKTVVVVQAHLQSGSRNAITHARRMRRPLFIVPAAPWMPSFAGSMWELSRGGARALCHASQLYRFLGIAWPGPSDAWTEAARVEEQPSLPNLGALETPKTAVEQGLWTQAEISIFSTLSDTAQHVDDVVARTGLPTSVTITALLTLSLKDVVVEGPDGFFRRR